MKNGKLTPEQIEMLFKDLKTRSEMKEANPSLYSREGKKTASKLKELAETQPEDLKEAHKAMKSKPRPKLSLVPDLPPTDIIPEVSDDVLDVMASELEQPATKIASESGEEISEKALTNSGKSAIMKGAKSQLKGIGKAAGATILGIGSEIAFPELAGEQVQGSDEDIIENPNASLEMRQQAIKRVKDKYLKPKDEQDEQ